MPYSVRHEGDQWVVVKKLTGKIVSHHDSKADAEASIRAIYSSENTDHPLNRKLGRQKT